MKASKKVNGRSNGGQEFGEVKANVQNLAKVLDEFRAETRTMRVEILTAMSDMQKKADERIETNEREINGLKKWRWLVTGGAMSAGVIASYAIRLLHG